MRVEDLANSVVKRLCDKNMQIATAERCTGGMVAQYITSISGSSNVFSYGIISYANSIKEKEGDKILPHLKGHVVAMAIEGAKLSSEKLSEYIKRLTDND